jgi:hypothetical protein
MEPRRKDQAPNEGEGNRTAARQYRAEVRRHVESGASEPAAQNAQEALDGHEGDELRKAKKAAKAGPKNRRPQ